MKNKILQITVLLTFVLTIGCIKAQNGPKDSVIGNVNLYLIDNYSTIGNTCQIDEKTIEIQEVPLINYSEFNYYNPDLFEFKISESAIKRIYSLDHSVSGIPFAVMANDSLIYSGYFIPLWSSTSCNWTIINPTISTENPVLRVKLGYPGPSPEFEIPDRRNQQILVEIFRRDNKLK